VKVLGVIGNPVSYSRSPHIFREFFSAENLQDWEYNIYELPEISALPELLSKNPSICGLNVTIPFKTSVIPFLNETDPAAEKIGAVNTIKISKQNNNTILKGYNTDTFGFEKSLKETFGTEFKSALILGSGGSSMAVKVVLQKLRIPHSVVSRKIGYDYTYDQLSKSVLDAHDLIINTTPLGMGERHAEFPDIPYHFLNEGHCCFDLVYTPELTGFLCRCEPTGARLKNGMDMLQYQAEKAWSIFKRES
jgi:shikimate dehydrogenase